MTIPRSWLITGASGLLGTSLRKRLKEQDGIEAQGQAFQHAGPENHVVDLRDEIGFKRLLDASAPEVVVHTVAYRDPDFCEDHPEEAYRLNVAPVEILAKHLPSSTRLMHISTDYVFRGDAAPYQETDLPDPVNVYGATKAQAEEKALEHPNSIVLRIPVLMGPNPVSGRPGFLQQMLDQIRNDHVAIEVDNVLTRHATWTRDLADVMRWAAGQTSLRGVLHASAQDGGTRYELTCRLAKVLQLPVEHLRPSTEVVPRKARRPADTHLLNTVLEREAGPGFHTLEAVLADYLNGQDWPHG